MQLLLNTLYVMAPNAYVRLENDTLRVDVKEDCGPEGDAQQNQSGAWKKRLQVPLHHLGGVVLFGNALVSPAVVHRCADEGVSLVFLDPNGRFKARLEGPVAGNILLRQAQHRKALEPAFALDSARTIVAGKIRNSRQVLLRAAREAGEGEDQAALWAVGAQLAAALRGAQQASDLDVLRGIEGEAARNYFSALPRLIRPDLRADFSMDGRTRRPPQDRFNALLSFFYSMLMNDCRSAVEAVGLDPQLGFLHAVRPGRAALALDLMEEFRPILADRLALTLVNRGQIKPDDFSEREGGAVQLTDPARKVTVVAYQERKREELTHPLTDTKTAIALLPFVQARLLARAIRSDAEGYLPFLWR